MQQHSSLPNFKKTPRQPCGCRDVDHAVPLCLKACPCSVRQAGTPAADGNGFVLPLGVRIGDVSGGIYGEPFDPAAPGCISQPTAGMTRSRPPGRAPDHPLCYCRSGGTYPVIAFALCRNFSRICYQYIPPNRFMTIRKRCGISFFRGRGARSSRSGRDRASARSPPRGSS